MGQYSVPVCFAEITLTLNELINATVAYSCMLYLKNFTACLSCLTQTKMDILQRQRSAR